MYLWKIEYNNTNNRSKEGSVVNCFKLCIFERLNTIFQYDCKRMGTLWIALNYVSLKDWIQSQKARMFCCAVVNCFKLCIFERLNTIKLCICIFVYKLWIALNYVSLKDWIQFKQSFKIHSLGCELL